MSARDAGTKFDGNVRTARKLLRLGTRAALFVALLVSCGRPSLGAGGLAAIDAYNIGRYHYAQGEYAKALDAFSEALERNPKFGVVYLARAKTYFQLGKQHEALIDSTTALKFHPHFVDALVTRGEVLAALGNFKAALADFDLAISLEPQNAVTFQRRSQVHDAQGRPDLAAADFKAALAIDPLLTDLPPLGRGDQAAHRPAPKPSVPAVPEPGAGSLAQVDDSREPASRLPAAAVAPAPEAATTTVPLFTAPPPAAPAIAAARQSLPGRPQLPRVQEVASPEIAAAAARQCFQRGQQLCAAQQWNDARAAFTQALDLDPQLTAAYGERGRAALAAGQHTQAIADYDALLQHSPGIAQGYYDRGRAHAALGHGLQALADFDAAIRLRPDNASFYAARAEAQAGLGHDQLAENDRQAAARLKAESASAGKAPGGDLATSETPAQPAAADGLAPTDLVNESAAPLAAAEATAGAPAADATTLLAQPLGIDNRFGSETVPIAVDDKAASVAAKTDRSGTLAADQPEPSQPFAAVANATPIAAPPALTQPTANDRSPTNETPPAHAQPLVEFATAAGREPSRLDAAQPAVGSEMVSSIAVVADGRSGAVVPASATNAIAGELPPRDNLARLAQLNQQLRTNPEDAERYLERAEIHVEIMHWEEALADANAVLRMAPTDPRAVLLRARIYARLGRFDAAQVDFERAIDLVPGWGQIYSERAAMRFTQGLWQPAIEDCTAALRLEPQSAAVHCQRGFAWLRLGERQSADSDFAAALKLDASYCPAMLGRAQLRRLQGDSQAALAELDRAVAVDPNFAPLYFERSLCEAAMGRDENARADRVKAAELTAGGTPGR